MKVVILAGGLGTRLMEKTESLPKPMVEIGGKPILWHIMKIYEFYGYNEFIICLGYKSHIIKNYFLNYHYNNNDITINIHENKVEVKTSKSEKFKIILAETGLNTNTAGRLKKISNYLKDDLFLMTYGDGVSDININKLINFHKSHGKLATMSVTNDISQFGNLEINNSSEVTKFTEKKQNNNFINIGFFVLNKKIFEYFDKDCNKIQFEEGPLVKIQKDNQLSAYKHTGFWKCMDAIRDVNYLNELWSNNPLWKIWK